MKRMLHGRRPVRRWWSLLALWPLLAAGEPASAPQAASEPVEAPLYVCPTGEKEAVYAAEPVRVECQPAKHRPPPAVLAQNQNPDLRRLWYQQEFGSGSSGDVNVLPRTPPQTVHLRQQPAKSAVRIRKAAPVRAAPPPKPPTPRQLIERDIASEQRALQQTRSQWQQAQRQGNHSRAQALQRAIADREANIRALQQELSRQR